MRREQLLFLALALLAGCGGGYKPKTTIVDNGPAPRVEQPLRPGQLTHSGSINLSLAQQYLALGELGAALDRAQRALKTDANNGNVHAVLGLVYDQIGDQAKAAEAFARAVALSPDQGGVLNAYGTYLCGHGDAAGAAAHFARALADPFFTAPGLVHYNSGVCLLKSGRAADSEAELRKAMDTQGSDVGAVLLGLAQAELAQGNVMEARGFVQRREAMGPTPEVLEVAAKIEDAAGNPAAAARIRSRIRGDRVEPAEGQGTEQ
jgi:type IV pilus assembly protein PilF